jgi:hypothetical protein
VWLDADGHDRLTAKRVEGRPVRFSFDFLSPFMVFDRVPWYANGAWLKPLLGASLAALVLTVLIWPVTAWVRRSYVSPLRLEAQALRAYRWSRIGALVIIAGLLLWALTLTLMLKNNDTLDGRLDPLVWLDEIFGTLAFIGGLVLMLWNLRTVWSGQRRWPAKLWSVVLTLSAATVLWFALAFKLISFGVHY